MNKREATRMAHAQAATSLKAFVDGWADDWFDGKSDEDGKRLLEAMDKLIQFHWEKGNPE